MNLSFSLCSSLFFLSFDLFLKEKGTLLMLSVSLSLSFKLPADFFLSFVLSLSLSLSLSISFSLSLSPLRCQWASNWGSVIGREKWLGEK